MKPEPIATYRVQLDKDFTLHDAAALVPYLARLGISHIYTSPCQQAALGGGSGYEVVDPGRVGDALGGAQGYAALADALKQHGMRHMLDIVPNHMSIAGSDNPWWRDVLKHGKSSHFASWFDVDWDASDSHWPNRVLLPVLGDQFGRVLEAGEFRLARRDGDFTLHYAQSSYPLEPASIAPLLAAVAEQLDHSLLRFVVDSLRQLPRPNATLYAEIQRRHQNGSVLAALLARLCDESRAVAAAIDTEVARINTNVLELGALIEQQNYRLAHWRAADSDLGYRRFFNVNSLAGLRVELPEVFRAVHELPLRWVKEGTTHALRVDHPDGLRDPVRYMQRLRQVAPEAWIVVEKILAAGEKLHPAWPVDGTTGYDFIHAVQGLFVDPAGETVLTRAYESFTGSTAHYADVELESKLCVLADVLGSEVTRLTSLLRAICENNWRQRDHPRPVLSQALISIAAQFQVYRSYMQPGMPATEADRAQILQAVAAAQRANPQLDEELMHFIQRLLLMEVPGTLEEEFALHFQQLTGPVLAKGIEDTAFYRYFRFLPLNEVGGNPARWAFTVDDFHIWCTDAQRSRPYSMLATSTHDTKRSEDVRARLLVLSEVADLWMDTSQQWRHHNTQHRGELVDANTEYLYYQTLIGAWPIDEERIIRFMEKAVRESKLHTDWARINEAYECQMKAFIVRTLADQTFVAAVAAFVKRIVLAGRINSLSQMLLKLTAPGIPDIYQGCEVWDLSLVDPDNRRPVDYQQRSVLLDELAHLAPAAIMARMDDALPKLWLLTETLRLRRQHADWFAADATYVPVSATGEYAGHVVAFMRGDRTEEDGTQVDVQSAAQPKTGEGQAAQTLRGDKHNSDVHEVYLTARSVPVQPVRSTEGGVITIVPRLFTHVPGEPGCIAKDWLTTRIALPRGTWRNHFDPSQRFTGEALLSQLLSVVPVALLIRELE